MQKEAKDQTELAEVSVNKTTLNDEIDEAYGLYFENYEIEAWDVFVAERNIVEVVYDDADATQAEVDTATENLQTALDNLVDVGNETVTDVYWLIKDLPVVDEITLDNKEVIESARAAYDNLSEECKALIRNLDKLVAAEDKLAELEAGPEEEQKAKADFLTALDTNIKEIDAAVVVLDGQDIAVEFAKNQDIDQVIAAAEGLVAALKTDVKDGTLVIDEETFHLNDENVVIELATHILGTMDAESFLENGETKTAQYTATITNSEGVEFNLEGNLYFTAK